MPRTYETRPFLCKVCGDTNPDNFVFVKRKSDVKGYYEKSKCRSCKNADALKRHRDNREAVASRVMKNKFGVTMKEYEEQLLKQNSRCPGCGKTREEDIENRGRRWPVDHDHETDAVRGILCWLCNLALGAVKDSPDTLRALAVYVENGGVW